MAEQDNDIRAIVRAVVEEFRNEPGYQAELAEERKKREGLEHRVSELMAASEIRGELQRLGVAKIDLAYRAVKDEAPVAQGGDEMRNYLARFVAENPELLPARVSGGSGATAGQRQQTASVVDLDRIRPDMSPEDRERVRQEIARVASQTLRGF